MIGNVLPRKNPAERPALAKRRVGGNERENLLGESILKPALPETTAAGQPAISGKTTDKPAEPVVAKTPHSQNWKTEKITNGLAVEQVIEYIEGKNRPILQARIRLSTASAGKRKNDGLIETAFVLRLEVLAASEGITVEGMQLGPWQLNGLKLEVGGIYLAQPIWTAFKPQPGLARGRVALGDAQRHRLLDLPLKTEALLPGVELLAQ